MGWGQQPEVQQGQVPSPVPQSQQPQTAEKWFSGEAPVSAGQKALNMRQQCAERHLLSICVKAFSCLKYIMKIRGSIPAILKLLSHHIF